MLCTGRSRRRLRRSGRSLFQGRLESRSRGRCSWRAVLPISYASSLRNLRGKNTQQDEPTAPNKHQRILQKAKIAEIFVGNPWALQAWEALEEWPSVKSTFASQTSTSA